MFVRLTLITDDADVARRFYAPSGAQQDLDICILYLVVEVTPPPKHPGKVGGGGLVASGGWAGAFGACSAPVPAPQSIAPTMPAAQSVALAQQVAQALELCKVGWDATAQA